MSVNKRDATTGELITIASGTRVWIGTKSAHDLAVQQGTMPNNCMVCITDESNSVMPDWSNAQSITLSTTEWEAPKDGWIVGYWWTEGTGSNLEINNVPVANAVDSSGIYTSRGNVQVMLSMGDKVKFTSAASNQSIRFVPFKTL